MQKAVCDVRIRLSVQLATCDNGIEPELHLEDSPDDWACPLRDRKQGHVFGVADE